MPAHNSALPRPSKSWVKCTCKATFLSSEEIKIFSLDQVYSWTDPESPGERGSAECSTDSHSWCSLHTLFTLHPAPFMTHWHSTHIIHPSSTLHPCPRPTLCIVLLPSSIHPPSILHSGSIHPPPILHPPSIHLPQILYQGFIHPPCTLKAGTLYSLSLPTFHHVPTMRHLL